MKKKPSPLKPKSPIRTAGQDYATKTIEENYKRKLKGTYSAATRYIYRSARNEANFMGL